MGTATTGKVCSCSSKATAKVVLVKLQPLRQEWIRSPCNVALDSSEYKDSVAISRIVHLVPLVVLVRGIASLRDLGFAEVQTRLARSLRDRDPQAQKIWSLLQVRHRSSIKEFAAPSSFRTDPSWPIRRLCTEATRDAAAAARANTLDRPALERLAAAAAKRPLRGRHRASRMIHRVLRRSSMVVIHRVRREVRWCSCTEFAEVRW